MELLTSEPEGTHPGTKGKRWAPLVITLYSPREELLFPVTATLGLVGLEVSVPLYWL